MLQYLNVSSIDQHVLPEPAPNDTRSSWFNTATPTTRTGCCSTWSPTARCASATPAWRASATPSPPSDFVPQPTMPPAGPRRAVVLDPGEEPAQQRHQPPRALLEHLDGQQHRLAGPVRVADVVEGVTRWRLCGKRAACVPSARSSSPPSSRWAGSVLAAWRCPRSSGTSAPPSSREPIEGLDRMVSSAVAYAARHPQEISFPPSAPLTPAEVPRGVRVVDPPDAWQHLTWLSLHFGFDPCAKRPPPAARRTRSPSSSTASSIRSPR